MVWIMHLAHISRDLVNIPEQESNFTCRIVASEGEFDVLVHHKTIHFAYQDGGPIGGIAKVAMMH